MQPFTFTLHLQTYVRGLFVIQPKYDQEEFARLISASDAFWPALCEIYQEDYKTIEHVKAVCSFRNTQTPWLIIIFSTDRRDILSHGLHEISHLADNFTRDGENRARFIEYVYMTFHDEVDKRL